jgi:hypothetical protein
MLKTSDIQTMTKILRDMKNPPVEEATTGDKEEYQRKRKEIAKKFGVESCSALKDEKERKACYAALDASHVSDDEEDEDDDPVGKNEEVKEAVLVDRDYKYDGKVIKISKKNFSKVHRDFKNPTKGKEMMMTYDNKVGTVLVPVEFTEEVEIKEASGSITITVKGISDLKKADAQMLRDTEFSIETILQDDGVEIEEGGSTYKRNSITFEADSSDMKIVQAFVKMRNQLSKDTAKLIKPKMDYGDLYQERVDGLYVAGLLSRTAKPNSPLQYSVNFIKEEDEVIGNIKGYKDVISRILGRKKEEVEMDEAKGTAYPATVDTLRKIVKDKQHQTVMFKSGKALVDLFTASAMVQVYDALKKPEMKKHFEKMIADKAGFMKTQAFAMKMVG